MGSYDASLKALGDLHGLPAVIRVEDGRLAIDAGDTHIGRWSLDEISLEPAPNGYRMAAEGEQILLELADVERFAEELAPPDGGRRARKQAHKRAQAAAELRAGPEADQRARAEADQRARAEADQRARAEADQRARAEADQRARAEAEQRATAARADPKEAAHQRGPAPSPPSTTETRRPDEPSDAAAPKRRKGGRSTRLNDALNAAEERWGDRAPSWAFSRRMLVAAVVALILVVVAPGLISNILLVCGMATVLFGAVVFTDPMLAAKWLPSRVVPSHVLLSGAAVLVLGVILAVAAG